MLKAVKLRIEQQLNYTEEQLHIWEYECQQFESQLQAQDELQTEIHAEQVYTDEANTCQSELLEAVKMEIDQIQAKLKEITLHMQESQQKKEDFIQHIKWIQSLDQQFTDGMECIHMSKALCHYIRHNCFLMRSLV